MRRKMFVCLAVTVSLGVTLPFLTFAGDPPADEGLADTKELAASVREQVVERMRAELTLERLSKELTATLVRQLIELALDDPSYPAKPTTRGSSPGSR